jgi:hypothetical protein
MSRQGIRSDARHGTFRKVPLMPGRFLSLSVRPSVYIALAGTCALLMILIDWAIIPSHRYSRGYFRVMALFGIPAVVFAFLGTHACRKRR